MTDSESAAAAAEDDVDAGEAPGEQSYQLVEWKRVKPSQTNPRSDWTGIEDLAASIKANRMKVPMLVRPGPRGDYDLVDGERRHRAAKIAGLKMVPVIVEELTDAEVTVVQTIANTKRLGLHPMDEAQQYERMVKEFGWTQERIAERFGVELARVKSRLKLCTLVPDVRKAFLEGKLDEGTAYLIARFAEHATQRRAWDLLKKQTWLGQDAERFLTALQRELMSDLSKAPFDVNDALLVSAAGACGVCPKNTAAQRELFSEVKKAAHCTDLACWKRKVDAGWVKATELAKKAKQEVLPEKTAKEVLRVDHDGRVTLNDYSKVGKEYVLADVHAKEIGAAKPWRAVLKDSEVKPILLQDPAGGAREVFRRKDAIAAAKKAGQAKKVEPAPVPDWRAKQQRNEKKLRETRELVEAIVDAALVDVVAKLEKAPPSMVVLRAITKLNAGHAVYDVTRGDVEGEKVLGLVDRMSEGECRALLAEVGLRSIQGSATIAKEFREACTTFGVDVAAIEKRIAAERKAAAKTEALAKKAKPKKGGRR